MAQDWLTLRMIRFCLPINNCVGKFLLRRLNVQWCGVHHYSRQEVREPTAHVRGEFEAGYAGIADYGVLTISS